MMALPRLFRVHVVPHLEAKRALEREHGKLERRLRECEAEQAREAPEASPRPRAARQRRGPQRVAPVRAGDATA